MRARETPTERSLQEAALRHVARYAATQAGLVRVLDRRIDRWAREAGPDAQAQAAGLRAVARAVAARLVATGAVNDAAFAAGRASSLTRAGRSRRAIAAHLAQRGTDADAAKAALPDSAEQELAAAVITARRRRLGPFRTALSAPETARRELGSLARAGFSQDIARAALALSRDEAEALIAAHRR